MKPAYNREAPDLCHYMASDAAEIKAKNEGHSSTHLRRGLPTLSNSALIAGGRLSKNVVAQGISGWLKRPSQLQ
jgi:hypothetical protein